MRLALATLAPAAALGVSVAAPWPVSAPSAPPKIYEFVLRPTAQSPGASGAGRLTLAWSPFGVAVSRDGHLVYDVELTLEGLVDPARLGQAGVYVAWIASPSLDRIEPLGVVAASGKVTTEISSWNKFLVLVTLEPRPDVARRSGPVVLQGRSPSGFLASFQSHELFNLIPH